MTDVASAHYVIVVSEYLQNTFENRWMGTNGPIA